MSTVITVENLGKKYFLHHQSDQQPYVALRDVLSEGVKKLGRKLLGHGDTTAHNAGTEEFWALKDVSFEVKQGDRIGIIGRNGAGKSTLLKILSRITEPTTGSVRIRGRVASLLEVGTGFHPELTGRENIYLNGAILGMSRVEIRKKFDEIVDFAEIERFLDTPVKRYSSGMYVRLAFAVAAHLEPEILVVDEVLAVGDAQFQNKCLGKMEDVSIKEGRTVFFVSHNMAVIESLCNRALLLNCKLLLDSAPVTAIGEYQTEAISKGCVPIFSRFDRKGEGGVRISDLKVTNGNGEPILAIHSGQRINFIFDFIADKPFRRLEFAIGFKTMMRTSLFYCETRQDSLFLDINEGEGSVVCTIDPFPLAPGRYLVDVTAHRGDTIYDWVADAGVIDVEKGDFFGNGVTTLEGHSPFLVRSTWTRE